MNRSLCLVGFLIIILSFSLQPILIKADSGFDSSWDSESSSYDIGDWDIDFDSSDGSSSFAEKLEIMLYVVPIFITIISIYYALSYYVTNDKLFEFLSIIFSAIMTLVEIYLVYKGECLIVSIICLLLMLIACICHNKNSKKNK